MTSPAPSPAGHPVGIDARPATPDIATRPVLRVGGYEVGEAFCPRQRGHPGIRY